MATSGTKAFTLDLGEIIEDAYERAGLRLRSGEDYRTAIRSLNMLFVEWQNRGTNFWTVDEESFSTVDGTIEYTLQSDIYEISQFFVRTGSGTTQVDLPLTRMSLIEYTTVPNKNTPGRPVNVWVDKQQDSTLCRLWPRPNGVYTIVYFQLSRIEDAGAAANVNPDVPYRFLPAVVAGLALKIAQKNTESQALIPMLKAEYEEQWMDAVAGDRDRSSFRVRPDLSYARQ